MTKPEETKPAAPLCGACAALLYTNVGFPWDKHTCGLQSSGLVIEVFDARGERVERHHVK